MKYQHLLAAVMSSPWAMCEPQLSTMATVVVRRVIAGLAEPPEFEAAEQRLSTMVGEVAVLPLFGVIVPRGDAFDSSGSTSAEAFTRQFQALVGDPAVKAIVLDIDSPGGSVAGIAEAAAEVYAARESKLVVAQVNHLTASAAYWIASQAHEMVISPSGAAGSIGVLMIHKALGRAMDAEGIDVQIVSAGKFKTEINERDPLDGAALDAVQARIDEYYGAFVGAVARGRGTTPGAVRAGYGEGRMLGAKPAMAAGMVDRIDTLDATVTRISSPHARAAAMRRADAPEEPVNALGLPDAMMAGIIEWDEQNTHDDGYDLARALAAIIEGEA